MDYRMIDLETYPRRDHFLYFRDMAYPYVGLTVDVEAGNFLQKCRERSLPFFLSFLYCVSAAANSVPELRRRILDGGIVEFDHCETSHTVAKDDGTYGYCRLDCARPFGEYLPYAAERHRQARLSGSLDEGGENLSLLFISTLPWVSYRAFVQPVPSPADSNPRITWGRWRDEGGRTLLPVSILCHHALADGLHIARFYQALDEELARF